MSCREEIFYEGHKIAIVADILGGIRLNLLIVGALGLFSLLGAYRGERNVRVDGGFIGRARLCY